jgi:outer membrane lipopolysaccharide assembly protein LptE/RlpB
MLNRTFFIALAALIFISGCGYHLKGMGSSLAEEYKTIAILPVVNKSFQADLGPLLDSAIAEEFSRSQRLQVVSESEADLVLKTSILKYTDTPASFSATDQARDYRVQVIIDSVLTATDREESSTVWKGKGLKEMSDYSVVPGDISGAESSRRTAKEELVAELAELIHDSIFEGF